MANLTVHRHGRTVVSVSVPRLAGRPAFTVRLALDETTGELDLTSHGAEHVAPLGIPHMRVRGVLSARQALEKVVR